MQLHSDRRVFQAGMLALIMLVSLVDARRKPAKPDVINQLSKLFGISRIPVHMTAKTPPQYMTDLYNSITDVGGLVKSKSPYNADVVKSFPDQDQLEELHFQYKLSRALDRRQRVLAAEFHVFKMRPRPPSDSDRKPPHLIELRLYQVLAQTHRHNPNNLRLLDAKRVSAYMHGWIKFNVTRAVKDWLNKSHNYGFLVTATSQRGLRYVNGSYVRFAQRHQHHQSKQPVLVLFTHEAKHTNRRYISPDDENYNDIIWDTLKKEIIRLKNLDFHKAVKLLNEHERKKFINSKKAKLKTLRKRRRKLKREKRKRSKKKNRGSRKRRPKRNVDSISKINDDRMRRGLNYRRFGRRKMCSRQQMYVDFEEIGWSGWIISPKGYNAYLCAGECPFPLGQNQKPTNHATVQSIVNALRVGGKKITTPCCVPNKLYSISLLYFDDEENVILKQYDEMVASSCGCH